CGLLSSSKTKKTRAGNGSYNLAKMDPARSELHEWWERTERALAAHEAALGTVQTTVHGLAHEDVPRGTAAGASVLHPVTMPSVHEPRIPPPERYGGESGDSCSFLTQCEIQFESQLSAFPTEQSKVACTLSLLMGRVHRWGTAEWRFRAELTRIFDPPSHATATSPSLHTLVQGNRSAVDYIIYFCTAAACTEWNEPALIDAFYGGHLWPLMDLVTRIDDNSRRAPQEYVRTKTERRFRLNLSLYCGGPSHRANEVLFCPAKGQKLSRTGRTLLSHETVNTHASRPMLTAQLSYGTKTIPVPVFIDSGSDASFIDLAFLRQHQIPSNPVSNPLLIHSLNNKLLQRVTSHTPPLTLSIDNHRETTDFLVMQSPHHPVVLGFPWLLRHDAKISWATGKITEWSPQCATHCLQAAISQGAETELEPDWYPDISKVLPEYLDLKQVFNKARATELPPPHRPYDCSIELQPGTTPPRGRLFSLSPPERKAIMTYTTEAQKAGLIRPSSSPAGAGFFFVGKKDGGLRPCIDYRGLNRITIKNRYPLPLLSTAFELLHGAQIFTKLDLRNAYHLVNIREGDEWKTAFNTPSGHFEYLVIKDGQSKSRKREVQ
uniref:ribonuclease H n=1 Tax=Monopterus albus TaxID=43700 RepID=A0A3Q3KH45_MONAL